MLGGEGNVALEEVVSGAGGSDTIVVFFHMLWLFALVLHGSGKERQSGASVAARN